MNNSIKGQGDTRMADTEHTNVKVHAGRRAGSVVSVRLRPDEAEMLMALAEREGRTQSEILRMGLQCFTKMRTTTPAIAMHGELGPHTVGDFEDLRLVGAVTARRR